MSVDSFHKVGSLVHLATARGGFSSNLTTIGYLPEQRRLSVNGFIPERKVCKFKHNRRVIAGTKQTILDQTTQREFKSLRKKCQISLMCKSLDKPIRRRRNSGQFRKHKQQTVHIINEVQSRSVQDLGIDKNRRRIVQESIKKDPILVTSYNPQKQSRPQYKKAWKQQRKTRDHGQRTQKLMNWNTQRKQSGYTQMYKKKLGKI